MRHGACLEQPLQRAMHHRLRADRRRIRAGAEREVREINPHPPAAMRQAPPSPASGRGAAYGPSPMKWEREGPGAKRREGEGAYASFSCFFRCAVGFMKKTSIVQPLGAVGAWRLPLARITKLPAVHSPS